MGRISFPSRSSLRVSSQLRACALQVLDFVTQRLPVILHFLFLLLVCVGPVLAPRLLALALLAIQACLSASQTRTAYGTIRAWLGTKAHANTDWVLYWSDQKAKLERDGVAHNVIPHDAVQHLILIPAYKEEMSTLKETIGVLASHPLASSSYRICLGMEEREAGAAKKAETLVAFYRAQRVFLDISYSMHPGTIVGEAAGKSSNINWAARYMAKRVPGAQHARCVVTVMDSDTCFAADYFLALAVKFSLMTPAKRRFTQFVPPIIFDRNGPDVPVFTRLADIFWACAGMGGIYPGSSARIPTSAYSVSLDLAKFCNFWDTGPDSIGEDMHFYLKAMFETKGLLNSVTIYSPASQMHVVGAPANGAFANYMSDCSARFSQAVRHMWGSLDFGYMWSRILRVQYGPSVRHPTYVAIDAAGDDMSRSSSRAEREDPDYEAHELEDAAAVKSLFEAKLKAAEHAGLVRAVSPAGESVITESSVTSADMFGMTRAKKFTAIDSPLTPHHLATPLLVAPAAKQGVVKPPSEEDEMDDDNDSDFGAEEDRHLFASRASQHSPAVREEDGLTDAAMHAAVQERRPPIFPFIVVASRLYEAHLMIVHFFSMMGIMAYYPSVIYPDGAVAFGDPSGRAFSFTRCITSFFSSSPYSPSAEVAQAIAAKGQPIWVMPESILCAKQLATFVGAIGVVATIIMFIAHDNYHHVCAVERWRQSDSIREAVLRERNRQGAITSADNPADMPPRYLGIRPSQTCTRKWPVALLDIAAFPAAIFYGLAPLLWAQLNHLATKKLTYVVSAKGKGLVVSTRLAEGETVEIAGRRWSVEHHRIAASRQDLAIAVPHGRRSRDFSDGFLPKPVVAA